MDLFSTLLSYSALNMVASSVWQISRGGNIIFTALFSAFFLKRKFSRSAIVGCCLAFIGITGVQLVTVLSGNSSSENDLTQQIIGIILLLLSIIFNSIGLVM
jgi:drug/metabolite transporter (DMT)-like permease